MFLELCLEFHGPAVFQCFFNMGALGIMKRWKEVCVKEASEAEVLGHIMAFNNEILPVVWQTCKAVLLTKPKSMGDVEFAMRSLL